MLRENLNTMRIQSKFQSLQENEEKCCIFAWSHSINQKEITYGRLIITDKDQANQNKQRYPNEIPELNCSPKQESSRHRTVP